MKAAPRPRSLAAWAVAMRPRSLTIAVSPVLVGVAVAYQRSGAVDAVTAGLVLAAALPMQVVTTLQNDVGSNHRDRAHHSGVGRRTFAVVFGAVAARRLFERLTLAPFAMLLPIAVLTHAAWALLPLVLLPRVLASLSAFVGSEVPAQFNALLLRCFALVPAFATLLSLGLVAAGVLQ